MSAVPRAGLVGAGVGVLAAGAAVGSLVGAAVERRIVRRPLEVAVERGQGYGSVHSAPVVVAADDGVQLYVEVDEARPDGSHPELAVVFCHGYVLNLDCWHHQRLALMGQARCIYWDHRGHGRSGRGEPGPVDIDRLGRDLQAVLEATVPHDQPVVLVGHSMGGMTIMALADQRPEMFGDRVVGAALLSTSAGRLAEVTFGVPAAAARLVHRAAPPVMSVLGRLPKLVDLGRRTGTDLEYALTRLYSFSSEVSPAAVDFVRQMNAGTSMEVVGDFFPAFDDHDKFAALPVLQAVETLVMVGEHDKLTPADHSREIARLLPGAELVVVPDSGHMVILERPELVDGLLGELLDRASPA